MEQCQCLEHGSLSQPEWLELGCYCEEVQEGYCHVCFPEIEDDPWANDWGI